MKRGNRPSNALDHEGQRREDCIAFSSSSDAALREQKALNKKGRHSADVLTCGPALKHKLAYDVQG